MTTRGIISPRVSARPGRATIAGPTFTETIRAVAASHALGVRSLGPYVPDRVTLVAAMVKATGGFTLVSLDGSNMTQLQVVTTAASTTGIFGLFTGEGSTWEGVDTAAVIVDPSGSAYHYGSSAYVLTGTGGATTAADDITDTTGDPLTGALDVPAFGAALGATANEDPANGIVTWGGLAYSDRQWNTSKAFGNFDAGGALAVSADFATPVSQGLVACSFAPA